MICIFSDSLICISISNQCLPKRPPSCSVNGVLIKTLQKTFSAFFIKESPSHSVIAGRITDTHNAEIYHSAKAAIFYKQITRRNISMYPNRQMFPL